MAAAVAAVRGGDEQILPGMGLSVCQSLSQRWVGPVGWVLAAWTRLMAFGGGVASIFRFGRPRDRGPRAVSDRRRSTGERGGRPEALAPERLHAVLRGYRMELLRRWPDAAEMLVRGRFDSSVRDGGATAASVERFAERFSSLWAEAVNAEIDRIPRRLSGFWLQAPAERAGGRSAGVCGLDHDRETFSAGAISAAIFSCTPSGRSSSLCC